MDISKIDKNFQAGQCVDDDGFIYLNPLEAPFELEGLPWCRSNAEPFYRLPESFTVEQCNTGVISLAYHTAGAALRFRSDSSEIRLRATLRDSCDMNHMPRNGSAGFDAYHLLYGVMTYSGVAVAVAPKQEKLECACAYNHMGKMLDWQINFPLYGGVSHLEIGLKADSQLEAPTPHAIKKPILFYGSSITQGGCASRPGNCYTNMLCRALDVEGINMGFSGSAKGELPLAELIASLDLSLFVYDYDHNAPTAEYLAQTHLPFYRAIRQRRPDLPIIMLSRCDFYTRPVVPEHLQDSIRRRKVVEDTWRYGLEQGDKLLWYIDGETLFQGPMADSCTVDGCHPNDLGFYRMYQRILPVAQEILTGQK